MFDTVIKTNNAIEMGKKYSNDVSKLSWLHFQVELLHNFERVENEVNMASKRRYCINYQLF